DHDHGNNDGEWYLWANASGHWVPIWHNKSVNDAEVPSVGVFPIYPLNVAINVFSDHPQLQITAFEDDGYFDHGGERVSGLIVDLAPGTPPPAETDDYILYYHVDVGPAFPTALKDAAFWAERTKDEPNDILQGTNLGNPVHVPSQGTTLTHSAYIT